MKYTKDLLNNLIKAFKYQLYSRMILITFSVVVLFSLVNLYSQMTEANNNYNTYLKVVENYEREGLDIEEALDSPVNINTEKNEEGAVVTEVSNVLRFEYDNVARSIFIMNPDRIVTQTLEWMSFIFYPLIFALYGIYMATYDIKYKTIKLRAVQDNWKNILLSKQLSSYFASVVMVTFSLVISYIVGLIFYKMTANNIPISDFKFEFEASHTNMFIQFVLSISICLIFLTIGFYLGVLAKGFILPTFIFVVYNFITPILGKYDLRNMISLFGHEVFDFQGRFKLFVPAEVSINIALLSITLFILGSTLVTYLLSQRQNKYII